MKKQAYVKPSTRIVELQNEAALMAASGNEIGSVSGLNDPFGIGGKSDGTQEINAKDGGGIWGFDEED